MRENHTLKRALTDPRLFSGIGNAYSDEILHAAQLSPLKLTRSLTDGEVERLRAAVRETLRPMDRSAAKRAGGAVSRKGDRLSRSDGGPRAVSPAVPGLRRPGAADRLRRQRVQLLREVPDRRPFARRSVAVAAAQGRLAEIN